MTDGNRREALDRRVEEVRRLMPAHQTAVDPGPYFVDRVLAHLPPATDLTLAWAARRVLPVTMALAAVLSFAVVVTNGSTIRPAAVSSTSQHANDPLDWLLENGGSR